VLIAGAILGAAPLAWVHFREKPQVVHPVRFQVTLPPKVTLDFSDAPMVSPNGRYLVIPAREISGRRALWLRPLDTLAARQLPGTDGAYSPFWSPDSRWVAFMTLTDRKLKKIEINGGSPIILADTQSSQGGAWNADGVILFNSNSPTISSIPSAGGETKHVLELDRSRREAAQGHPRFLPGGRQFLYLSRSQDAGNTGIYLASLDSKERRRLVTANSNPS